jgi:mannose-6-phosphate isomerase-like protein (cupin superfamily)
MKIENIETEEGLKLVTELKKGSPIRVFRIFRKNKFVFNEDWHLHPEGHEYYCILKGKAKILIEDKEIILKEGEMLHVLPGEKHTFLEVLEAPYDSIVFRQEFTKNDRVGNL